ncbi:hypothetical protein ACVWZ9_004803 [Pseudomonas chlororaphis]
MDAGERGLMLQPPKSFRCIAAVLTREPFEDCTMFRRITRLIPLLAMLALSGCIIFPHDGWHHRHYDGGPGYYYHR